MLTLILIHQTMGINTPDSRQNFLQTAEDEYADMQDNSALAEEYIDGMVNIVLETSDDGVTDGVFYKTTEDLVENIYYISGMDDFVDDDSYITIFGKVTDQDAIDFGLITNQAALDHMNEHDLVIEIDYGQAKYVPEAIYFGAEEQDIEYIAGFWF